MDNMEALREETIFKAEHTVTDDENREFQKFVTLKYRMGTLIFLAAFEVIFIYLGINAKYGGLSIWWGFILAAVIVPIQTLIPTIKNLKKNKKTVGMKSTFLFCNTYFENISTKGDVCIKYAFCEAYETKDSFYIVHNKRMGFIIGKNDFEQGTAEDFGNFLSEKFGAKFKVHK